jgi:short-subunit dehydrogenase
LLSRAKIRFFFQLSGMESKNHKTKVFISGGTKGMGYALVNAFAADGYQIFTCSRSESELVNLESEMLDCFSNKINWKVADLQSRHEVMELVREIKNSWGIPDILINNAGVFEMAPFLEESDALFERMWSVNFVAPYILCKELGVDMLQRGTGLVVNICSTSSLHGIPNTAAYTVSKHALMGLTRTLRQEWKSTGVKVTAVIPGSTFTASWDGSDIEPERLIQAKDIAKMIIAIGSLSDSAVVEEILIRPAKGDL